VRSSDDEGRLSSPQGVGQLLVLPQDRTGQGRAAFSSLFTARFAGNPLQRRSEATKATGACDESRREALTPVALTDDQDKTSRPWLAKQRLDSLGVGVLSLSHLLMALSHLSSDAPLLPSPRLLSLLQNLLCDLMPSMRREEYDLEPSRRSLLCPVPPCPRPSCQ
jgi:hypothetical protein